MKVKRFKDVFQDSNQNLTLRVEDHQTSFSLILEDEPEEWEVLAVTKWEINIETNNVGGEPTIDDFLVYVSIMCDFLDDEPRTSRNNFFHVLREGAPQMFGSLSSRII